MKHILSVCLLFSVASQAQQTGYFSFPDSVSISFGRYAPYATKFIIGDTVYHPVRTVAKHSSLDKFYLGAGSTFVRNVNILDAETGVKWSKNILAFNMSTYDVNSRRRPLIDREWYGGIKYYRVVPITGNFSAMAHGNIMLDFEAEKFVFIPGVSLKYDIGKWLFIQGNMSWPIQERQNANAHYRKRGLNSGLLAGFYLFNRSKK